MMFRVANSNTSKCHSSIPRPVLALFVSYRQRDPFRLLPVGDFLRFEFELKVTQYLLKENTSKWMVSLMDNSYNHLEGTNLLLPLEHSGAVPLALQTFGAEVHALTVALSSSNRDFEKSRQLEICREDRSYSYNKVCCLEMNITI